MPQIKTNKEIVFKPSTLSKIIYSIGKPNQHTLVCYGTNIQYENLHDINASALFSEANFDVSSLIYDILKNPHIRVILLYKTTKEEIVSFFEKLKSRDFSFETNVSKEHLELLATYLDIYTNEYTGIFPMPPFWKEPIIYV